MMTTLAALFGALPRVLSGGDGSEFPQPFGITLVAVLGMSQLRPSYTQPWEYDLFPTLRSLSLRSDYHSVQT
ncbi:multidrug efflux system subunit B [Escherichia coli]|nr:multidrug efflux system subunit B [Escherichia coli]